MNTYLVSGTVMGMKFCDCHYCQGHETEVKVFDKEFVQAPNEVKAKDFLLHQIKKAYDTVYRYRHDYEEFCWLNEPEVVFVADTEAVPASEVANAVKAHKVGVRNYWVAQ